MSDEAGSIGAVTTLRDLLDALSWAVGDTGVTQKRLAELTGLSEKHVSQMMTGRVVGALDTWQDLIDAAGAGFHATVQVLGMEPCEEFGQHRVGGHADAVRAALTAPPDREPPVGGEVSET